MNRRLRLLLCSIGACVALGAVPGLVAQASATPFAESANGSTPEGSPVQLTLSGGSDVNAVVTFSIASPTSHGSLGSIGGQSCVPNGGGGVNCTAFVTYTPDPGYFGGDQLTYGVDDGTGTANGPGNIDVRPVPSLPAPTTVNVGQTFSGTASHLIPGATVNWGDGTPDEPLTVNPDGTASLNHAFPIEGTFSVTATNHNGPHDDSAGTLVFAVLPGVLNSTFGTVDPGTTGALTLPNGLDATLAHSPGGSGPATLFLALYGTTPGAPGSVDPSVPVNVVAATIVYDVRVTGADGGDRLTVKFSLPAGTSLANLLFFNPATNTFLPVRGSSSVPNSYVVDAATHTVTVIFDGTSLPALSGLGGTRFAVLGKKEAPRIDRLRLRPRCTAVGRGAPSLRLSLSQAARVEVSITRRTGSRARTRCPSHKRGRRNLPKSRFEGLKRVTRDLPAGAATISRPLRLGPGSYRVTVTASNSNGRSVPQRRSFLVLP